MLENRGVNLWEGQNMKEKKRFQTLMGHNIEHNEEHIKKLRELAEDGEKFGISSEIEFAIEYAEKSNNSLKNALDAFLSLYN